MRRKKHSDRGGGGGGTELFICFTSRPSSSGSSKVFSPGRGGNGAAAGADAPPAALLRPSLSRRLRNSGSLKGGQSPMFPPGSASGGGGRRGRGGLEPAEPSSPKVTCIGQVRVKGGKRKPKHASASSSSSSAAAALRSRSRRGGAGVGGGSEASFRRAGDDRDGLPVGKSQSQGQGQNQGQGGWVYQIPVNICEALKTFGSCGGRSLCSASRERRGSSAGDNKKRRRAPAGGSWLCGAAVARCLLAIQEEDDEAGKGGAAVGPADEAKESEVGLVMQGWDVEVDEEEEEAGMVVGEVEVKKDDEILVVGGKEEEGRVSVCIPPRNALLLMRCRSDPVRMAALATRFWGSPAAANVGQVDNGEGKRNEEEEEEEAEGEANVEKECDEEEACGSAVSAEEVVCRGCGVVEDCGREAGDVGQVETEAEEGSSKHGDLGEEEKGGGCGGDGEKGELAEAQIVRKDTGLEVALAGEDAKGEIQVPGMVEVVADSKETADVPRQEKEEEEMKGRRSISSSSPSAALKEDRKLRRLSSRRRIPSSSRASSSSDRVDRRHSFSAEMDARRSSFSSLKDSRRASFSIDRDGRRWSFTIEQEHLVAEPKVLMASRKKIPSEPESEKGCAVLVAPNSAEEAQESQDDDGKEEAIKDGGEEETTEGVEINEDVEKVEIRVDEKEAVEEQQVQRKKSGELPDCLLMMMCEPKLSMEVSRETWVCSTDFVHWKSYQGQNRRNGRPQKDATGSNAAAPEETKDIDNAQDNSIAKATEESGEPAPVNSTSVPPQVVQKPPRKPAVEQKKLKLELPMVAGVSTYAPFVLKRCKSEPLRSSARLAPDTCFWKDRHRPLNATGIGF